MRLTANHILWPYFKDGSRNAKPPIVTGVAHDVTVVFLQSDSDSMLVFD